MDEKTPHPAQTEKSQLRAYIPFIAAGAVLFAVGFFDVGELNLRVHLRRAKPLATYLASRRSAKLPEVLHDSFMASEFARFYE